MIEILVAILLLSGLLAAFLAIRKRLEREEPGALTVTDALRERARDRERLRGRAFPYRVSLRGPVEQRKAAVDAFRAEVPDFVIGVTLTHVWFATQQDKERFQATHPTVIEDANSA